jgi:thiamine-phosphate pyrophosphorylase
LPKPALGRLHVITDEVLQTRYSHAEIAAMATRGGADTVQYREKRPRLTRELVADAGAVISACAANGAQCIVDDRADVTVAVGAQGLHLGRDDLAPAVARTLLGPDVLIGGTANSIEEAREVWQRPIDYLGVGPVYGTQSKANPAPVLGIDQLRAIVRECPVPVIAIGSITAERTPEVLDAGAHGVAVLSAITCAADPEAAAREFATVIAGWLSDHPVDARFIAQAGGGAS